MINKLANFVKEVKGELKKVSWSTKDELIGSTMVVVVTMFLLALFIGFCDFLVARGIGFLFR